MFDPASMAAAGTFMSGASSFLGGLGIGGGEKRPRYQPYYKAMLGPEAPKKYNGATMNSMIDQISFDGRMQSAAKHGLHPLTVLGVPTSGSSPTAYLPGSSGPDLNAMGQGIDRMANAGRSQVQRKLDELNLEHATLSNDYLRVQIAGAQKAISRSGATIPLDGTSPTGNNSPRLSLASTAGVSVVNDEQTAKSSKDSGTTAGNHAAMMKLDLGNGMTAEVPKSDQWAESLGELPIWYAWPKMAEIAAKRFTGEKIRKPLKAWTNRMKQKKK